LKTQNEIRDKNDNPNGLDFNKHKIVILITGAIRVIGGRLLNELIKNREQIDVNYLRGVSRHKDLFDIEKLRSS